MVVDVVSGAVQWNHDTYSFDVQRQHACVCVRLIKMSWSII